MRDGIQPAQKRVTLEAAVTVALMESQMEIPLHIASGVLKATRGTKLSEEDIRRLTGGCLCRGCVWVQVVSWSIAGGHCDARAWFYLDISGCVVVRGSIREYRGVR